MTDGATPPMDHRRFALLDDPERPPRPWRWWLVSAGVVVIAVVIIVVVVTGDSSSRVPTPTSSTAARAHLPAGAQPLPGATDGSAESFGTLGGVSVHRSGITKSQALRRYDRIPGVISRKSRNQRVFAALVRGVFIDHGHVRQGTFWIISVWYHPPNVGVSPQHQWCVDHGIVNADSGTAGGHIAGCLPLGKSPKRLP